MVSNYRFLTERSAELSLAVGRHFDQAGSELFGELEILNADPCAVAGAIGTQLESEAASVPGRRA